MSERPLPPPGPGKSRALADQPGTCALQHCACAAPSAREDYCSAYCANVARHARDDDEPDSACACGHAACRDPRAHARAHGDTPCISIGGSSGAEDGA